MQEKDKSNLILLLLIVILVIQIFSFQNQKTYSLLDFGQMGLAWRINNNTGEVSVCIMRGTIPSESPECSPWSKSNPRRNTAE